MTGMRKGCGFVSMGSRAEADIAIAHTNDKIKLEGARRELIVRYATQSGGQNPNAGDQKEHKLYCGMLSRATTEQEVRAMFAPYGNIIEIYIMRDTDGNAKGSAFVKYGTAQEANAAIAALDGKVRDKDAPGNVQVRYAQSSRDKQQVQAAQPFQQQQQYQALQYQQQQYQQQLMQMMQMQQSGQMTPQQMAYQQQYMQQLQQQMQQTMQQTMYGGMQAYQPQAPKIQAPRQQYGPPNANLFVYNVPEGYTDADMNALFANFGNVISANVQKDLQTGRPKGYGFVSYDNGESAQAAIKALDGFVIGQKKLSVRIKGQRAQNRGYSPY
jgi:CUG-BP- and ETR3-like factor